MLSDKGSIDFFQLNGELGESTVFYCSSITYFWSLRFHNQSSFQVQWEFRWENEDGAEVHGPHKTEEMIEWQESGFFDKGVFVRKVTKFRW